jgi:Flp pilus assembly protein TadD
LALDYPHLQAARKLIREHKEEALGYFQALAHRDPQHPNAHYALGVALMELGEREEAEPHLKKALDLARPGRRKVALEKWLRDIDRRAPRE